MRPDTLVQHGLPITKLHLATHGRPIHWVNLTLVVLASAILSSERRTGPEDRHLLVDVLRPLRWTKAGQDPIDDTAYRLDVYIAPPRRIPLRQELHEVGVEHAASIRYLRLVKVTAWLHLY